MNTKSGYTMSEDMNPPIEDMEIVYPTPTTTPPSQGHGLTSQGHGPTAQGHGSEISRSRPQRDEPLLTELTQLNRKFRLSCKQVVLLNNAVEYLQERYNRSVKNSNRTYRYFLRLRLATLEGIRNMYYEYACRKADELDGLHERLLVEGIIEQELDLSDIEEDY